MSNSLGHTLMTDQMIGNLNNDKSTGQGPQFTNVVNRSSEDSTKRQHICILLNRTQFEFRVDTK